MAKIACFQCGGLKFGLVRQKHHGKSFCKLVCLDSYKAGVPPKREELPPHKPPDRAYDVIT